MKHLVIGLALFMGASSPSLAGTILPNLFASRFCTLREIGATYDQAMAAAVRESTISQDNWIWVEVHGQRRQSDVVEAVNTLMKRCPQYLQ